MTEFLAYQLIAGKICHVVNKLSGLFAQYLQNWLSRFAVGEAGMKQHRKLWSDIGDDGILRTVSGLNSPSVKSNRYMGVVWITCTMGVRAKLVNPL